jgi:hypothetical protein
MGDIIGSVLGTSTSTTQKTVPDEVARAQNLERLNQLVNLFATGGLNQFTNANPDNIYSPTNLSTDIGNIANNNLLANQNIDYSNIPTLQDYQRSFDPVTGAYNDSIAGLDSRTATALGEAGGSYEGIRGYTTAAKNDAIARSYRDFEAGTGQASDAYSRGSGDVNTAYNAAIARGDYDLARSLSLAREGGDRALGLNEALYQRGRGVNESNLLSSLGLADYDAQRSLGLQDANRARALELGIGATGNYIDQIATPRLNAALTLQGLESGGALPAAIARATAETAMPYLQSIENTYGTNQANTLNSLMGLRGELTGNRTALDNALAQELMQLQTGVNTNTQNLQTGASESAAAGNRQLGGQALSAQAGLATTYQNNINQLAQALMANNITLEQAGISAESALGQSLMQVQNTLRTQQQQGITSLGSNYGSNATQFATTLPAASQAFSLLPGQMQAAKTANLTGLQGIADFPRQLQEADYLRRQGLFTTAYTGIPYTPGSTTFGGTATGNIFDQLGGTIQSGLKGGGNIGG